MAVAFVLALSVQAVPARRQVRQVKQADGTLLTVTVRGDENFHFTSTTDGLPLAQRVDGTWCYALIGADGRLTASAQAAHDENLRQTDELQFLTTYGAEAQRVRSLGKARAAQRNKTRVARLAKRNAGVMPGSTLRAPMVGAGGGEGIGVTGKRKGLVILVNFKDVKMKAAHSQTEWNNFFNQKGYSNFGNSGSVHDYFYNQSYGQFDLSFDVVGPVTLSKNMVEYGGNDSDGNDVDPAGMAYEACKLVASKVNFADYDWDGDGEVDQVFIIYAGYGEAADPDELPNTIWPHEWVLSESGYKLTLNGVKIDTYGCSAELSGSTGSDMDGIGTACHEFSHCLGLPDLYDTDYSGGFGMDEWDLMDAGSYAGDGYRPVGYNSYEKWVSGWLQPTVLKSACYVNDLKPLSEEPQAYIIYNDACPTEYYMLENRQQIGTDEEVPAHGMLVLHVDYDKKAWDNNQVNDVKSHQRLTIIPADNKLTSATLGGDTYPGTKSNRTLDDSSTPAAKLWNTNSNGRKFMEKPITEISEAADGTISFTFMGGEVIDAPANTWITAMNTNSFAAAWTPVEGAESYSVQLREKGNEPDAEQALMLAEDFTKWTTANNKEGTTDISASLDKYMTNKGWTGAKVYQCPGYAKLGSSKNKGNLMSPVIKNPQTGNVTVRICSSAYGSDVAVSAVTLHDASGNQIASQSIVPAGGNLCVNFANPDCSDFRVKVQPEKRGMIYSIAIYDGEFSEDDFADAMSAPAKMAKAPTKQFDQVKTTTYAFNELTENGIYQWRVRTVKGKLVSAWTEWMLIDLSKPNSIQSITASAEFGTDDIVEVYTVDGAYVGSMTVGSVTTMPLAPGLYVAKKGNKSMKIMK